MVTNFQTFVRLPFYITETDMLILDIVNVKLFAFSFIHDFNNEYLQKIDFLQIIVLKGQVF